MKINKATKFINEVDIKRFRKNSDLLSKAVEKDLQLIAWIAWGMELLFKNYSYQQMYSYIGNVNPKELQKLIEPVELQLRDEEINGVILDVHYKITEGGKITGFLNIENQIDPYRYFKRDILDIFLLALTVRLMADNINQLSNPKALF